MECLAEILTLQASDQAFFIERSGRGAILLAVSEDVVAIVDVGDEIAPRSPARREGYLAERYFMEKAGSSWAASVLGKSPLISDSQSLSFFTACFRCATVVVLWRFATKAQL